MREILVSLLVKLLSRLPLSFVHGLGVLLGGLFYWIPNKQRRNANTNIDLCLPELSAGKRRTLLRRSLIENAKTLLEMPGVWLGRPDEWVSLIRGENGREILQTLLADGKGVIVAAPHLGSWEAGIHYLADVAPITALYRPPREPGLSRLMSLGRSRGGAKLVATDAQGVRALYEALRNGEMVTILPDQQPKVKGRGSGVFAPFFGIPAYTMVLVNRLARKTGAPVIFSFAERLPRAKGYVAHWVRAPEGIAAVDPVAAATALNKGVESCVRRCPEQYQWSYKRFHARPKGEPRIYGRGKKS